MRISDGSSHVCTSDLDPLKMAGFSDEIAKTLAEIDPDHEADFAANAADFRADLEALDKEYVDGMATCERTTVVVNHDAFGHRSDERRVGNECVGTYRTRWSRIHQKKKQKDIKQ